MSDTLSRAKALATTAWDEVSSTVSLQRQVRGLQKQIADRVGERDRVMLAIGSKVFTLYGRGKVRNADILPLCERIEELNQAIAGLNERVQELSKPKPRGELHTADVVDEGELAEEDEQAAEADEAATEEGQPAETAPEEAPAPEGPEGADPESEA